ncbi:MAG: prepilin peptidase [Ndongobacter sp.]|nr:prepilin peptidase [Ndongobacter sp.]
MNPLFWLSAALLAEGGYQLARESEERVPFFPDISDAGGRGYAFTSVLLFALFYMKQAAPSGIFSVSGVRQLLFFQLLPIAWIDGRFLCIPNRLTARILAAGLGWRLWLNTGSAGCASLWPAASFTLLISFSLIGLALLAPRVFGMGDAKLLSALSLFYSPEGFLLLCVMSLCAAPIGLLFRRGGRDSRPDAGLPLAPGIALAIGLL